MRPSVVIALVLRPFILLAFFSLVALIAWPIRKRVTRMRDSQLKRALLQPVTIEAARYSWWPFLIWSSVAALILVSLVVLANANW